jgi:hypothetical protein
MGADSVSFALTGIWTTNIRPDCRHSSRGITVAVREKRARPPVGMGLPMGIVSIAVSIAALVSPHTTLAAIMGLTVGFAGAGGVALLVGASTSSLWRTK